MRLGDLARRLVVGRLAVEIDRDHAARLEPAFLGLADRGFEALHVHVERVAAAHRRSTGVAPASTTTSAVATKVKAGTNTASPGPMPSAISAKQQSVGAVGARRRSACAPQNAASCRSSSATSGPRTYWPCFEHRGDRRLDAVAELLALCGEVDEGRDRLAYGLSSCDLHRAPCTFYRGENGLNRA